MSGCVIDGCGGPIRDRGRQWCSLHYQRWWRLGDPRAVPARSVPGASVEDRLRATGWTISGDCWEFNGHKHDDGYGTMKVKGKTVKTHRLAYECWVGPIPEGASILHSCDNPPCINPAHLRAGSQPENIEDMVSRSRQRAGRLHSAEMMAEVKRLYKTGRHAQADLEQRFGLSSGTVSRLMSGKIWKELE